jgi:hypothetical protein
VGFDVGFCMRPHDIDFEPKPIPKDFRDLLGIPAVSQDIPGIPGYPAWLKVDIVEFDVVLVSYPTIIDFEPKPIPRDSRDLLRIPGDIPRYPGNPGISGLTQS